MSVQWIAFRLADGRLELERAALAALRSLPQSCERDEMIRNIETDILVSEARISVYRESPAIGDAVYEFENEEH